MIYSDIDWDNIDIKIKNKLIEISSKDLEDIKYLNHLNAFVYLYNNELVPIGCQICLSDDIGQDDLGYITLAGRTLLNCKDMIIEGIVPVKDISALEISPNVWMCPNCHRWILDFIPKYDIVPVRSFECQPTN